MAISYFNIFKKKLIYLYNVIFLNTAFFYASALIFKVAIDIGYWKLVSIDINTYPQDFNIIKYIAGFLVCFIMLLGMKHNDNKPSTFFLSLMFFLQIIPITTIYSLGNQNTIFYGAVCCSFLLCETIVCRIKSYDGIQRSYDMSKKLDTIFCIIFFVVIGLVIYYNGIPSTLALDLDNVYDLRENDPIKVGKYLNYAYVWCINVIIPFFITKTIIRHQYYFTVLLCAIELLMFLYSGHKTILFTIPLVIVCTLWSRRRNFYKEIIISLCLGMTIITLLASFCPIYNDIWRNLFSLFGRRMMLLSANNKFVYFDYFSDKPIMGLGGIFPRWLVYIPNY